ncbi:DUF4115 domain-containing protein [Halomonas cibimaris]|uniref:DUF4115 domain-containing protein n=1 Tax=Halomonas cibimaris TaxID=657012 RepID=A0ABP7M0J6_9GAMM
MSDTHNAEYADDQPGTSPGQLLRCERQRQALSLEEAANALHLRPAVVSGLEQDDYAEIPIATYRRGYLRTYARYLGMDETPVLDAYRARHGTPDSERVIKPVSVTRPPSKLGGLLFKLVTLLVIAGLIGVTVTWWQSRGGSAPPALEDSATSPANAPTTTDTPPTTDAAGELPDPLPDDTPDPGAKAATDSASAAADAPERTAVAAPAAPTDAALTAAARVADAAASATREAESAADANTLALTFNQQSWTEIFDARDQRVFVGLQQPGTEARVEGQPPFRLTIGNATGVELRYQGKVVDLAAQAGANNVARFTLGE